jgi:hypothetical protein
MHQPFQKVEDKVASFNNLPAGEAGAFFRLVGHVRRLGC